MIQEEKKKTTEFPLSGKTEKPLPRFFLFTIEFSLIRTDARR
jgi:hypothetical protein